MPAPMNPTRRGSTAPSRPARTRCPGRRGRARRSARRSPRVLVLADQRAAEPVRAQRLGGLQEAGLTVAQQRVAEPAAGAVLHMDWSPGAATGLDHRRRTVPPQRRVLRVEQHAQLRTIGCADELEVAGGVQGVLGGDRHAPRRVVARRGKHLGGAARSAAVRISPFRKLGRNTSGTPRSTAASMAIRTLRHAASAAGEPAGLVSPGR